MPLPWLRLWTEIQDDPTVIVLPEVMRWRYIMLLVSARKTDNSGKLTDKYLAVQWRIPVDEVAETKEALVSAGLCRNDWTIPSWDKRQPNSDSSSERSRKSRERKQQNETLQGRSRHVLDKNRIEAKYPGRINGFDVNPFHDEKFPESVAEADS